MVAMAESFFALLESELLSRGVFKTKAEASMALFTYVEALYNYTRRHGAFGQISPTKLEELHTARASLEIGQQAPTGSNDSPIETIQANDNAILTLSKLSWSLPAQNRPRNRGKSKSKFTRSVFDELLLPLRELICTHVVL
jgi:hypothetical protein